MRSELGQHLSVVMLIGMTERGPDSAGIAVYHRPTGANQCKLTLFHARPHYHWRQVGGGLGEGLACAEVDIEIKRESCGGDRGRGRSRRQALAEGEPPGTQGHGLWPAHEVYKDMGLPAEVVDKYGVPQHGGVPCHRPHADGDRERCDDRAFFPSLHRGAGRLVTTLLEQPQQPAQMAAPARRSSRPTTIAEVAAQPLRR